MYFYLIIGIFLFFSSIIGLFFIRTHLLLMLIVLELMLLASTVNFVVFSFLLDDFFGQVYVLLIFTVAAAESSLGLALLVVYYRVRGNIAVNLVSLLKS